MICPRCNHDQRRRLGMRCSSCRYTFTLDPKQPPYCADRRFMHWVDVVSDNGNRWYTPRQLHSAMFARRNRGLLRRLVPAKGSRMIESTVAAMARWQRARRELRTVVDQAVFEKTGKGASRWPEPDLDDYGAEGVLIVDDPLLVDLLVRNQAHTRCKVAIIAANGYPRRVATAIKPTVAARPDLPIFLLHGTSDDVTELEMHARAVVGAATHPVIDLGLPADAPKRIKALRWARRMPKVPADVLPHRWLTDGLATAIANRVALIDLLQPRTAAGSDGVDLILWSRGGDDDFG